MHKKIVAAALTATMIAAAPAYAAGMINEKTQAKQILSIAQNFGTAQLDKDSDGNPLIKAVMDGRHYNIYFFNCSSKTQCAEIQFAASWSTKGAPSLAKINEWNLGKRFGRAYIGKDKDPWIEMDVNLNKGVTDANLRDNFEFWRSVMSGFENEVVD